MIGILKIADKKLRPTLYVGLKQDKSFYSIDLVRREPMG